MAKKQRHVKAKQAAQARMARNIKQLGVYSTGNLAKTADKQLANIANTLGREWERQKQQAINTAAKTEWHPSAVEKPTSKDRMLASRAPITDQQIAAEPVAKRRKLLRQQQRKIRTAQAKIAEWNKVQALPKQSVLERRRAELAGTTGDAYESAQITDSKLTDFLRMTNTLQDRAYVMSQLESGHRKELIRDIRETAAMLGHKVGREPTATKTGRSGQPYDQGTWPKYMRANRYAAFEKAIAASVGSKRLKRFRQLSTARKRALIEQTDVAQTVFNWVESPTGKITSRFGQDSTAHARARQSFEGFLKLAKELA